MPSPRSKSWLIHRERLMLLPWHCISNLTWFLLRSAIPIWNLRSEEHTSELQSHSDLVCPDTYTLSLHDALPICRFRRRFGRTKAKRRCDDALPSGLHLCHHLEARVG